jgi:hypothetical protein
MGDTCLAVSFQEERQDWYFMLHCVCSTYLVQFTILRNFQCEMLQSVMDLCGRESLMHCHRFSSNAKFLVRDSGAHVV